MRTSAPTVLPLFRSEMQLRMLALLLLQPERVWTLQGLVETLGAPQSSVHRELERAEAAGVIGRDATVRPHRFRAAVEDPLFEPIEMMLSRTVGVEAELRGILERDDVDVALIFGSWAGGSRRPESDIDVLVVGDVDLRELRRRVRPVGESAGRRVDLTVLAADEFRRLVAEGSSFARSVMEGPTIALVGDLTGIVPR